MKDDDGKLAPGSDDAALIAEAKAYYTLCERAHGENWQNALDDLRFLAGEQWDPRIAAARAADFRPVLTINKLPTFLHQVTNDQRQNVPGIKVHAVEKGDDKVAEVNQGLVRHIEYAGNADIAYDTSVNNAAAIGFGYWELLTRYCAPDSFDQELYFRPIRNSMTVKFDPLSELPDGSDQRRCLIDVKMHPDAFRHEYPRATMPYGAAGALGRGPGDGNEAWLGDDFVRVGRYYRIELTPAKLHRVIRGGERINVWADELQDGDVADLGRDGKPLVRDSERVKVMLYTLTALEVLDRVEVKFGGYIPVFPVYGDVIDIDGKVHRAGLVRHAKDPARMYNYWMTCATEEVALRTKTPYVGAVGQFETTKKDWEQAANRNFPYLEYDPITVDGVAMPPPQRQPMADIPAGALQMAMHANDNIKATTGLFDSSIGATGSARSGVQERAQQRQGDTANFHYTDNLNRTVRHCGRCILAAIPNYYDATRIVRIMGEDGSIKAVEVNKPGQVRDEQGQAIEKVLNDLTVGKYDVTVSSGPSYDTLRQELSDQMIELGGKWPALMEVAGDKLVRALGWPGGDEIADRIKQKLGLTDPDDEQQDAQQLQTPEGPIPMDQAQAYIEGLAQQLQEASQMADANVARVEVAKINAQSKQADTDAKLDGAVKIAVINALNKLDVTELSGFVDLLIAKTQPPPALAAAASQSEVQA